MVEVFREVRRVLREDGTVFLNLGDSYAGGGRGFGYGGKQDTNKGCENMPKSIVPDNLKPKDLCGIPWRVAFALQADGWWLRSAIVWAKPNPMPESVTDRPTSSYEFVFLLTRSARYYYDADAVREPATVGNNGSFFHTGKTGVNQHRCSSFPRVETGSRNLRDVWTIPTMPFPEAHFATFPKKLVEPCVRAGCPPQVCAVCGAGWVRVVEPSEGYAKNLGKSWHNHKTDKVIGQRKGNTTGLRMSSDYKTIGWRLSCDCKEQVEGNGFDTLAEIYRKNKYPEYKGRPSCECGQTVEVSTESESLTLERTRHVTKPGLVLDPFAGSGTAGVVALTEGRDFIGFDLNPDYCRMANERLAAVVTGVPVAEARQGQAGLFEGSDV